MKKMNIDSVILLFLVTIFPLLIFPVKYQSRLYGYIFAAQNPVAWDTFLVVKVWALLFLVIFMGIRMLSCHIMHGKNIAAHSRNESSFFLGKSVPGIMCGEHVLAAVLHVLAAGLAVLLIFSTLFSVDAKLSLLGADEQFEPLVVLLCYMAVAVYAGWTRRQMDDKWLFDLLSAGVAVILIVSGIAGAIQRVGFGDEAYLTLYNSNYAGMFLAMLLPLCYLGAFNRRSILRGVGAACGVIALICTGAKAAMAVAVIVFVVSVCCLAARRGIRIWACVVLTVMIAVLTVLIFAASGQGRERTAASVSNVETMSDGICFTREGEKLLISFEMIDEEHYEFLLKDGDGNPVAYEKNDEGTRFVPSDERFAPYEFTIADYGDYYGFIVYVDGREWYLAKGSDGEFYYVNGYTGLDKFVMARSIGFDGWESFATNRGYIWSRSLPLLFGDVMSEDAVSEIAVSEGVVSESAVSEDTVTEHAMIWRAFIGYGPDTFAAVFPQNDVAKYLYTDLPYKMIITKPHNMYLQLGCQCGIPALLIFLAIVLLKIAGSVRTRFQTWKQFLNQRRNEYANQEKNMEQECSGLDSAILLCVISFLLMGMFYDSSVCVTPVFCLLLGLLRGKGLIRTDKDN